MENYEYIIIAETETRGFVVEILYDLDEAIKHGEYIFDLCYLFFDEEELEKSDLVKIITSYTFKEQFVTPKNLVWGSTNGMFDLNVLKVKPGFKISKYISERCQVKRAINLKDDLDKICKFEDDLNMDLGVWLEN